MLQRMHRRVLSRKYRLALTAEKKRQYELKVLAERLFESKLIITWSSLTKNENSGKKKSYASSFGPPFQEVRLSNEHFQHKTQYETNQMDPGEKLVVIYHIWTFLSELHNFKLQYCTSITKYDRHGYSPRARALILTNKAIHIVDTKGFKVKHKLQLDCITELVVTSETDGLLLVRIPLDLKKDKVKSLICKLCKVVITILIFVGRLNFAVRQRH
jgi:myosin I